MSNSLKSDYKKNIDGLRAIAVISVVIFHLDPNLLSGGFIGVDIFFVISGYLISKIIIEKIDKKEFQISSFFMSRARRILPMLIFILIIFAPLMFFLLPSKMISISESILSSLFFVANILFYWESGYFGAAINLKPYIHLWSLSVEEQFYIVFPIYCILFYKKNFFLLSLIGFFLISLFCANNLGSTYPNANFFLTPTRVWEILSGVFFMLIEKKKLNIKFKILDLICFLSLTTIILSFVFLDKFDNIPNIKLLPAIISTGVLIVFGENCKFVKDILCNKLITFIGLISYSMYMLHQPFLAFNKNIEIFEENIFFKIIFFIILLLISTLTWKFIEQPFRDRKKITNKKFVLIISLFVALILVSNIVILKTSGFVSKYKDDDKYLALLNPQTSGRYVSKKFNSLINKNFKKREIQNILVIGDSHAEDFINMAYENDYFKGYNLKTHSFDAECYLKFVIKKDINQSNKLKTCKEKVPDDLQYADTIFLANVWEQWIIDDLKKILENEIFLDKKVYLIGVKTLGKFDIKNLIKLNKNQKLDYRFKLADEWIEMDKDFKSFFSEDKYISPYSIYCDKSYNCRIFTNNNELISFDGNHLTKMGAKFFGEKLFKNENLMIYKSFK